MLDPGADLSHLCGGDREQEAGSLSRRLHCLWQPMEEGQPLSSASGSYSLMDANRSGATQLTVHTRFCLVLQFQVSLLLTVAWVLLS